MGIEAQGASPEATVFRTAFGFPSVLIYALLCLNPFLITQFSTGAVFIASAWLCAAGVIFSVYVMLSTKYRVVDGVLHMHQAWSSRIVDLESILRIQLKGATFRDPTIGLGSRRITICYKLDGHKDCKVCVTPKDVDGFLEAIGARRTGSGDVERGALDRQRGEMSVDRGRQRSSGNPEQW